MMKIMIPMNKLKNAIRQCGAICKTGSVSIPKNVLS